MFPTTRSRPTREVGRPAAEYDLGELSLPPIVDPTPEALARLVQTLALRPGLWQSKVGFDPDSRYYARLGRTDTYEAWLLTWLPGQSTDWHDHGDSAAAFAVAGGILRERTAITGPAGRVDFSQRHLPTGTIRAIAPGHVHEVLASTTPAITIHAYGPALTTMTRHEAPNHAETPLRRVGKAPDRRATLSPPSPPPASREKEGSR